MAYIIYLQIKLDENYIHSFDGIRIALQKKVLKYINLRDLFILRGTYYVDAIKRLVFNYPDSLIMRLSVYSFKIDSIRYGFA